MGLRGIPAAGVWLALVILASSAGAQAPERSPLPVQRPVIATPEARAPASPVPDTPITDAAAPVPLTPEELALNAPAPPDISASVLAPSVPSFSLPVPQAEPSSVTGLAIYATGSLQRSPQPEPRPEPGQTAPDEAPPSEPAPAEPTPTETAASTPPSAREDISPHAPSLSLRPVRRTSAALARFTQAARPPAQTPTTVAAGGSSSAAPTGGGLCGVSTLEGRRLSRIASPVEGCGVAEPVSVTAVAGVRLSQPATLDCDTARAFDRWVRQVMQPAMGRSGGGVTQIRVAAHYTCRPRNNRAGARVSEHGRGRAIDIAGFRLASGQTVMVLSDWARGPHAQALRQIHASACGIFRTTLGPGSDGHHEDHFHFDMAARANNSTFCR